MDIKDWIEFTEKNILTKKEAMEITGQSLRAFGQSVAEKRLKPIFERGEGVGKIRLFLRSDVEIYAKQVKERRKRLDDLS